MLNKVIVVPERVRSVSIDGHSYVVSEHGHIETKPEHVQRVADSIKGSSIVDKETWLDEQQKTTQGTPWPWPRGDQFEAAVEEAQVDLLGAINEKVLAPEPVLTPFRNDIPLVGTGKKIVPNVRERLTATIGKAKRR